jgi:hypothetical protein
MDPATYRARLQSLGLASSDLNTQYWLGLSRRHLSRIYNGHSPVPGPLARLLNLYARFGLVE